MNNEQIIECLSAAGKRPSMLAKALGVTRAMITFAMQGQGSRKARLEIAHTINKPPSLIWPYVSREQMIIDDDAYYHSEYYQDVIK